MNAINCIVCNKKLKKSKFEYLNKAQMHKKCYMEDQKFKNMVSYLKFKGLIQ